MRKKFVLLAGLAALFLNTAPVFAQPQASPWKPSPIPAAVIQGRIADRDTNEGISGVKVIVRSFGGDYYSAATTTRTPAAGSPATPPAWSTARICICTVVEIQ